MILDKIFGSSTSISDLRNPRLWLLNNFGGGQTSSGVSVNSNNALTVSGYFGCIRNLSEDVGTVPIFPYEAVEPRGRDKARNHPLWPILTLTPNSLMSSTVYRQAMMFSVLSFGNAYSEIVRNRRGRVTGLNFIHPTRVKPHLENGVIWYEVHGEIGNGEPLNVRLEAEDMLHFKGPSEDGIIGLTMIQIAAQSIGVALAEQDFNGELFKNGAVMSGVLSHPKTLQKEAHERLRESWKSYTGTGNRHKPLILEEEMKWTPMGVPPRDAQFIESRNFTVTDLARWFRMPPHKLMHLENATYSNIESQDLQYVNETLMPWFIRIEQEMTIKLLSDGERSRGLFISHKVEGRMRGDAASRSTFYRALFNMGALSPNDIRELEDMNPIGPEGDRYYLQINIAPIEDLPALTAGDDGDDDPDDPPPQAPTDTEESEENEEAQSALAMLTRDAVERSCRRWVKGKRTDSFLLSQQEYMRSCLVPISVAFERPLDSSFFSTLTHDDFADAGNLYIRTMEMINGYPA